MFFSIHSLKCILELTVVPTFCVSVCVMRGCILHSSDLLHPTNTRIAAYENTRTGFARNIELLSTSAGSILNSIEQIQLQLELLQTASSKFSVAAELLFLMF